MHIYFNDTHQCALCIVALANKQCHLCIPLSLFVETIPCWSAKEHPYSSRLCFLIQFYRIRSPCPWPWQADRKARADLPVDLVAVVLVRASDDQPPRVGEVALGFILKATAQWPPQRPYHSSTPRSATTRDVVSHGRRDMSATTLTPTRTNEKPTSPTDRTDPEQGSTHSSATRHAVLPEKSDDPYCVDTLDAEEDPKNFPVLRKWISVVTIASGTACATCASSIVCAFSLTWSQAYL